MRYPYCRILFSLVIITVLFIVPFALNGCQQDQKLPYYTQYIFEPPPATVSLENVYNDYMTNINEAKEKYEGKRFLFEGLEVDRVENSDKSIMVGNVKLKPRYEIDLDQVFPGFIIDVAGVPQSLFLNRILIVNDCWVFIVEGGEYELPPFY